eukprot:543959-Amphidinium_carterae.1
MPSWTLDGTPKWPKSTSHLFRKRVAPPSSNRLSGSAAGAGLAELTFTPATPLPYVAAGVGWHTWRQIRGMPSPRI